MLRIRSNFFTREYIETPFLKAVFHKGTRAHPIQQYNLLNFTVISQRFDTLDIRKFQIDFFFFLSPARQAMAQTKLFTISPQTRNYYFFLVFFLNFFYSFFR